MLSSEETYSGAVSVTAAPVPMWVRWALGALLVWSLAARLVYGSAGLHASRFYDERYTLRNVRAVLASSTLEPNNAYYPSLSYLPQAAVFAVSRTLHRATGREIFSVYNDEDETGGGYTPTAYFLARMVQAIFGTLSLWATFAVGRRLMTPAAALFGVFLLSVVPNHLRLSAFFKPDILVTLLTLVTFLWTLEALGKPTRRKFWKVGVGVGLAVAAKYTGVTAAIPVIVATGALLWRHPPGSGRWRPMRLLVEAGVASVLTFVLLNPHLGVVFRFAGKLDRIYKTKGSDAGGTHWTVLGEEIAMFFSPAMHGPLVGIVGALGLMTLVALVVRGRLQRPRPAGTPTSDTVLLLPHRVAWGLALSFFFGFLLIYAGSTTILKVNNFLPVIPFFALAAAWLLGEVAGRGLRGGESLRRAVGFDASRLFFAALALVTVAAFAVPTSSFALSPHRLATQQLADRWLSRELGPKLAWIVLEKHDSGPIHVGYNRPSAHLWKVVDRLTDLPPEELDLMDGEIFPKSRMDGDEGAYTRRVLSVEPSQVEEIEGTFWRSRGPDLVILAHRWQRVSEAPLSWSARRPGGERLAQEGWRLPTVGSRLESYSVEVWLPRGSRRKETSRIAVGERTLELFVVRRKGKRILFSTERFRAEEAAARFALVAPRAPRDDAVEPPLDVFRLVRWERELPQ